MLEELERLEGILRCPSTGQPVLRDSDGWMHDESGSRRYPVIDGIPVLIDFGNSVLDRETVLAERAKTVIARPHYAGPLRLIKRVLSPDKVSTRRNVKAFIDKVTRDDPSPLILVIGGGTVGQGMAPLYGHPTLRVVAFDIYRSVATQFVADAHNIPLGDGSVDGVVIQAVLEHVLEPQRVVDEIWRVLAPGGSVYAETPFLQHVHEGAYDFTRFTESGHRYLFRKFALIQSGVNGGAGTQLMWSIDYFMRGVFRSRRAGKLFKLLFAWLRVFDRIIPEAYASDAASGVYFMGTKVDTAIQQRDIISFYRGSQ
ncbi:MAG TPA: class I SAM-dependent methyltransferase [Sphingobium sp.]